MKNMMLHLLLTMGLALTMTCLCAQQETQIKKSTKKEQKPSDSKLHKPKRQTFFGNIFKQVKSLVMVSKQDSLNKATVIHVKSVVPFIQYQGKVIRFIKTTQFTFDQIFTDTTQRYYHFGTKALNALHSDTRAWVINDNLFFKRGDSLNPYLLSDNERHLRSLEFIQDARIVVRNVKGNNDSVDVEIITKDLFSITGSLDFSGVNHQKVSVGENNLAGAGQKVQLTMLHDANRSPAYGFDFLYSKTNIAHSFVRGTVGYSRINSDPSGADNVASFYLQASRPLVSPDSKLAGAFEWSFNQSKNTFSKPDSLFFSYRNENIDLWAGYNFGSKKLLKNDRLRKRTFVALRYMNRNFFPAPYQIGNSFNSYFNKKKGLLGEVTFFRQEFYKTNYIYGFGTTEDVPYGYNIAVTGGWIKQLELARPYVGFNANFYSISNRKGLSQYYIRNGFFINQGHLEDVSFMLGGSMFSRLHYYKSFKIRQYFKANFSRIFGRTTLDPLQINNPLGLRYFSADTLKGTQRLSIYTETFFFAKYRLLGFLLAPFVFGDASMLKAEGKSFFKSEIYTGIGGGIRTRNVNLVFGTAELRVIYFPRKAQETNSFVISFTGDIQFRYNSNYVRAPDIIQLNSEDISNFY